MKHALQIYLDGLDAFADGRGFNTDHERALHLLTAAPDLLDALTDLVEQLQRACVADQFQFDRALKALDKATGGAE